MAHALNITPAFLSAGCSRQPAGAVWSKQTNQYFFASNKQILVASPRGNTGLQVDPHRANYTGHTQPIRALAQLDAARLVSVSADHSLRVWSTVDTAASSPLLATLPVGSSPAHVVTAHVFNDQAWIMAADTLGKVVAYVAEPAHSNAFRLAHEWTLRRYAVAAAMHPVTSPQGAAGLVLALSTADSLLHVYLLNAGNGQWTRTLTLSGHENWVTALDFVTVPEGEWTRGAEGLHPGDVLLASGSMDKFIRIWRFTFWDSVLHPNMSAQEEEADQQDNDDDDDDDRGHKKPLVKAVVTDDNTDELLASMLASLQQDGQLSTKAHLVAWPPCPTSPSSSVSSARHPPLHIYLDSVLFGHDDWIHSLAWSPTSPSPSPASPSFPALPPLRLASASADKSILIWSLQDGHSWQTQARVGEMGGSVLSMHAVQWSPAGRALAATGYSGAVHLWTEEGSEGLWQPQAYAPSGHVGPVKDLLWDPLGHVVLTTSADQTTRVWARPRQVGPPDGAAPRRRGWAEWARPQIHGYDLHALAFADPRTLVAAADEKVVRVFGVPLGFARAMHRAGIVASQRAWGDEGDLVAVGANLPALGLSNKPVTAGDAQGKEQPGGEYLERQSYSATAASAQAMLSGGAAAGGEAGAPPLEEHRLQQTLWPELDKLYGHGYECVAVAGSAVRAQVFTTCKATSPEHAVVRVYDAHTWQEVQVLGGGAHSLTVTAVAAAPRTGKWVVSAGRDRGWALWTWNGDCWELACRKDKAHARIIWDVAWSGMGEEWFVTASRDKSAKVWRMAEDGQVGLAATIAAPSAVTSVAVHSPQAPSGGKGVAYLALGLESGGVQVMRCDDRTEAKTWAQVAEVKAHTDAVNAVAWHVCEDFEGVVELASCSEDGSVRVYEVTSC